jgi:hypothetical protein
VRTLIIAFLIWAICNRPGEAQAAPDARFYRGLDYGSQATLTPLTIWLNRSFETLRLDAGSERINWNRGLTNVWGSLMRPGTAIRRVGGWREWVSTEIIPFQQKDYSGAAWFPNYMAHLLAGGIDYRYTREWYEAHHVPRPRLAAAVTAWSSAFMNEVVEAHASPAPAASTVADLLVFDVLAAPVFEIDAVVNFFSRRLRASEWSPMVSIAPSGVYVENTASEIAYKFGLPFTSRVEGVYTQGMEARLGAMVGFGDGHHIGGAMGVAGSNRTVDPVTLRERVDLVFTSAVYWDRNDSLLGSVSWEPARTTDFLMNVYPGALPGPAGKIGIWAAHQREGGLHIGVATRRLLGLGVRVVKQGTRAP